MELVFFLVIMVLEAFVIYWFLGNLYSMTGRPAVYFPASLAAKMALFTLIGVPVAGVGGIVLAIWIFDYEFNKRENYNRLRGLCVSALMAVLCSVALFFSLFFLGWEILG